MLHDPGGSGIFQRIGWPCFARLPGLTLHAYRHLENPIRLVALFVDAERRGLVKRCEADRFAFFAAAERAKRVATRNTAGCFVHIVRHGCFGFAAQQDEDLARAKISALRQFG